MVFEEKNEDFSNHLDEGYFPLRKLKEIQLIEARKSNKISEEEFEILNLCDGERTYKVIAIKTKMGIEEVKEILLNLYAHDLVYAIKKGKIHPGSLKIIIQPPVRI